MLKASNALRVPSAVPADERTTSPTRVALSWRGAQGIHSVRWATSARPTNSNHTMSSRCCCAGLRYLRSPIPLLCAARTRLISPLD